MITNDVSDYKNLLVRIAHIICNHPLYVFSLQRGKRQMNFVKWLTNVSHIFWSCECKTGKWLTFNRI